MDILDESEVDNDLNQAYQNAFVYICNCINETIVKGGNITSMTMLNIYNSCKIIVRSTIMRHIRQIN